MVGVLEKLKNIDTKNIKGKRDLISGLCREIAGSCYVARNRREFLNHGLVDIMEKLVTLPDAEIQVSVLEIIAQYAMDDKLRLQVGRDRGFCHLLLHVLRATYGRLEEGSYVTGEDSNEGEGEAGENSDVEDEWNHGKQLKSGSSLHALLKTSKQFKRGLNRAVSRKKPGIGFNVMKGIGNLVTHTKASKLATKDEAVAMKGNIFDEATESPTMPQRSLFEANQEISWEPAQVPSDYLESVVAMLQVLKEFMAHPGNRDEMLSHPGTFDILVELLAANQSSDSAEFLELLAKVRSNTYDLFLLFMSSPADAKQMITHGDSLQHFLCITRYEVFVSISLSWFRLLAAMLRHEECYVLLCTVEPWCFLMIRLVVKHVLNLVKLLQAANEASGVKRGVKREEQAPPSSIEQSEQNPQREAQVRIALCILILTVLVLIVLVILIIAIIPMSNTNTYKINHNIISSIASAHTRRLLQPRPNVPDLKLERVLRSGPVACTRMCRSSAAC